MSIATVPPQLVTDLTRATMQRRGHQLHNGEIRHQCPFPEKHRNDDADPSCRWNPDKATFYCDACHEGGGAFDLARALGFDLDGYTGPMTAHAPGATNGHAKLRPHERFVKERRLPASIFRDFDMRITSVDDRPALVYPTGAGERFKFLDGGKPKARWLLAGDGAQTLYNLTAAVALLNTGARTLYLVNGEPSDWACHAAGVPAVALCTGEQAPHRHVVDELQATLAAVDHPVTVAIAYDTDAAGAAGSMAALDVLGEAGLPACIVRLPKCVSDVDDLHRINGDGLGDVLASLPRVAAMGARPDVPIPIGTGIGTTPFYQRIADLSEPEPRRFIVGGNGLDLIPEGAVASLFGDSGFGKTILVTHLALHLTLGLPWLGIPTVKQTILFLDAELTVDEFMRRAYRLARGLHLGTLPENLYYSRLPGPVTDPNVRAMIDQARAETGAKMVILDSIGAASVGSDQTESVDAIEVMKLAESWGTSLLVDHIAKPAQGANLSAMSQFGSYYKRHLTRSQLQVVQAEGGGIRLRHTKSNFSSKAEPFDLAVSFSADAITVDRISATDDRMRGIDQHVPASEKVYLALADYDQGATPEQLSDDLGIAAKTVKNHLTTLHKRGRVASLNGVWTISPDPGPDPYGDRDRDSANAAVPETCWACGSQDVHVHPHNGNVYCNSCMEPLLKNGLLITANGGQS